MPYFCIRFCVFGMVGKTKFGTKLMIHILLTSADHMEYKTCYGFPKIFPNGFLNFGSLWYRTCGVLAVLYGKFIMVL